MLDTISANVASQLTQQAELGVEIGPQGGVPDRGPVRRGVWVQIPEGTAVFADLKGSAALNTKVGARTATYDYTYFNRAMEVILEGFDARNDDPLRGEMLIAGVFDRTGLLDVCQVRW